MFKYWNIWTHKIRPHNINWRTTIRVCYDSVRDSSRIIYAAYVRQFISKLDCTSPFCIWVPIHSWSIRIEDDIVLTPFLIALYTTSFDRDHQTILIHPKKRGPVTVSKLSNCHSITIKNSISSLRFKRFKPDLRKLFLHA